MVVMNIKLLFYIQRGDKSKIVNSLNWYHEKLKDRVVKKIEMDDIKLIIS